jgi:phosphate uptake regulator
MSEKKTEEPMEGRFVVDMSELRRPVDDMFPGAHRQVSIAIGTCVSPPFGCSQPIKGFRDEISAREYKITGMCQACQDKMFEEEPEEGEFDRFLDPDAKGEPNGQA